MFEFEENHSPLEHVEPVARIGAVWVERGGSITIHLSVEEAERLAHALPYTNALAKEIREALRTGGPISPMF